MKVLLGAEDDFPSPPSSVVDSRKYYEAYLRAEEILAAAPKRYQDQSESRLTELMSYIYRGGDKAAALYRKREDAPKALAELWLSTVRDLAGWYVAASAIPAFKGLDQAVLKELPRRFCTPATLPEIAPFLADLGIVLVCERAIPSMKLDGAVFSLSSGHVVVGLSLRYSRLDHFWFTILHELAHVALHADQLSAPILEDLDRQSSTLIEKEADRLALDSLIPRNEWRSCSAKYSGKVGDIVNFAALNGIPPQCVAGRLQREMGRFDLFSEIINKYDVREILGALEK